MIQVISNKIIKFAMKDYHCDACEYMLDFGSFNEFCQGSELTFAEKRSLVRAKQKKYKIYKGDSYLRQFLNQDGDSYEFKAIAEIHEICVKYKIYQD